MERAARKASEMKDSESRAALAEKAIKHREQAERFVEEVGEVWFWQGVDDDSPFEAIGADAADNDNDDDDDDEGVKWMLTL